MRSSLALGRRLARLEIFTGGPCPACSGRAYLTIRGHQQVPVCEQCGQPVRAVRIIRDKNFFQNAARLGPEADDEEDI
jgi:hypothetical protein